MLGYLLMDEVRVSGLDFALLKFFYRSTVPGILPQHTLGFKPSSDG